jgi:hypothetical protein
MGTDEAHINHSIVKVYPGYQTISVATDIEHHPPVRKNIGAVEQRLDRCRISRGAARTTRTRVRNGYSASRCSGISRNAFKVVTEIIRI